MQTPRKTIIAALVVIGAIASASAQLSYHLDANTNSYTLQTPNSQQTFTRYFGQANGNGIAASQSQQQPAYQQDNSLQSQADLYLRQQQIQQAGDQQALLQQQQQLLLQQQQQQQALQQQQQQQALQQQQPQAQQPQQSYSNQDVGLYYQQLQQAQQAQQIQEQQQIQLQQQQQQQFQPQYASQQINQEAKAQPQQQSNLLRVAYSPSNEVSQVKYTSNGLNYNF